jgi:serine/threonine-protein kinase
MSRVFVAVEVALDREVVIKVLPPELAAGVSTERFKREIHFAARLQHPHIVPLLAAGVAAGLPYFTMPFVDGESLRSRLAKRGEMPVAEAVRVLREIASALAYAHAHGVVHRDIKPDNVLLSAGAAMVTDFGVAKALSVSTLADHGATTSFGVALGTPAYMAPEQASADPCVDYRADVYAFGIVAYELLTGQTPFGGRSPQGLLAAQVTEQPESINKRRASLPPALAQLVMHCLEKRPADRPQTADEIVHALDALTTPSLGMTPANAMARIAGSPGEHSVLTAAGVALMALLLAGGAYGWHARRDAAGTANAGTPLTFAVLPFEHAGPAAQASFTDGLTDAVTAKLSAVPTLAVIDRRSAAQYRRSSKPTRQIGTELGARYLLEGVVRWAQDRAGVWRAQVTPTLIDARSGMTTWTGEPVVVTPDDPFSAQSTIATTVVDALKLAVLPADRAALSRPFSNNAEAFASYERGRAIQIAASRTSTSPHELRRAIAEFTRATSLDTSFVAAWVSLAGTQISLARALPGDSTALLRARSVMSRALAISPRNPLLLLMFANMRYRFDHDTTGLDTLVSRAMASAPNDADALSNAAYLFWIRQRYDSAYGLAARAALLDPRSAGKLQVVSTFAGDMRRWPDALRWADALIALDSTDERGWDRRLLVTNALGDTVGMQRDLSRAMASIPHPSISLLVNMPYASDAFARRFVSMSARELGVATLYDSVWSYLDTKADAYARLGDRALERVYYDSMATILTRRALGSSETGLLSELALAQAATGRSGDSRRTLDRLFSFVRGTATRPDLTRTLDVTIMGGTYARLSQPDSAVRWLERTLADPAGRYTANGLAANPKLLLLHGTPAFERFMREHPQ